MPNSHAWTQARMPAHNPARYPAPNPACPRALRRAAAHRTRTPILPTPSNIRRARFSDAAELSQFLESAFDRLIVLRKQAG